MSGSKVQLPKRYCCLRLQDLDVAGLQLGSYDFGASGLVGVSGLQPYQGFFVGFGAL